MAVAAGYHYTLAVGKNGEAYAWGLGRFGQLGLGDDACTREPTRHPTRIASISKPVRQVAAKDRHTGLVTDDGELFMCGDNKHGQLGLGKLPHRTTPTLLKRPLFRGEAIAMVACGDACTGALTEGGSVYTFGSGNHGALGHGDKLSQSKPTRVQGLAGKKIVMVAVGGAHMVALSDQGHVYTWGDDECKQLGHGDRGLQVQPRQVDPKWFPAGDAVVFIAAGSKHTAAVTASGRLYTWGGGGATGQYETEDKKVPTLVPPDTFQGASVVSVACGHKHTLALTAGGQLWACGWNRDGQLGLGDEEDRTVFERVDETCFFLPGGNKTGAHDQAFKGQKVVAVSAGVFHSMAVTADGTLYGLGSSQQYALGHGPRSFNLMYGGPSFERPLEIVHSTLRDARIGRFLGTQPKADDFALAFAMSLHARLGAGSVASGIEEGLVQMILDQSEFSFLGCAGAGVGLRRLVGFT